MPILVQQSMARHYHADKLGIHAMLNRMYLKVRNLIHLRLKEIDGPESNKISVSNIIKKLRTIVGRKKLHQKFN